MKLRYTDRALQDLEMGVAWYEKQQKGLGLEFLGSLESSLKNIHEHPQMHPVIHRTLRRCLLKRFPFSVFYTFSADDIVIHAIFDNRQDPRKKP